MDVEFVPESSPPDEPEDELVDRAPRTPRWVPLAIVAVLVAVAIGVVAQRSRHGVPRAAPTPTVSSTSETPPFPVQSPVPEQISTLDPTLFGVYSTALDTDPAHDIVRNGSTTGTCPLVKIGTKPQTVIADTLVEALRRYARLDIARIIDQDAGLCAVQVRARDKHGNVAVLRVTAPDGTRASEFVHGGDDTIGGVRVEYAEYRSGTGWHVVVGAAGPTSARDLLPLRGMLQELSMNAVLRW